MTDDTSILYGRTVGSSVWTIVVPSDELEPWPMADSGLWSLDGCAAGSKPDAPFGEIDCREFDAGVFCYAGDDEYRAPVAPACEFSAIPVEMWPASQCGAAVELGDHPWASIECTDVVQGGCFGVGGNTSMVVRPPCWIDSMPVSDDCQGLPDIDPPDRWAAGELWGPCPVSEWGTITLCNSESYACIPADNGESNMCLPVGECPDDAPFKGVVELGWGEICYPRCMTDQDCQDGMECSIAMADGGTMCAWPWPF